MEQLHSQQSIVRTDFTLKYYHLESLLKAHDVVEITGSDQHVFLRSWMDYVKAKGDGIVTWTEGDFGQLLASISQYSGEEIVDESSLKEYLNQQTSELVFCVDSQNIEVDQLQSLFSTLSTVDKQSASIEAIDKGISEAAVSDAASSEDSNSDLEKKSPSPRSQSNIKLVLCMPDSQKGQSVDQQIASFNATTFQVGEAGGSQPAKTTKLFSKKPLGEKTGFGKLKILLAVFVVAIGISWHFNFLDDSVFAGFFDSGAAPAVAKENDSSKNDTKAGANQQADDKAASTSSKEGLEDLKNVAGVTGDNAAQSTHSASTKINEVVEGSAVVNESNSDNKGGDSDSQAVDSKVSNPPKEDLVIIGKTVDPSLNPEKNSKPSASETVAISSVKSANGVNLGSSIRTKSEKNSADSKSGNDSVAAIEQLVDGWIDAWQAQEFDKYQQFYSDDFKSGGQRSHSSWLKWRKKRIEKPKWIKLSRSNIKHLSDEASELYQIQLTLIYSSPNYRDKTFKRMTFKKLDDSTFKIVKEENLKVTKG